MGDPEDETQQSAPDPGQPDEDAQPQQPTSPDEGGAEPDNTWEGDKADGDKADGDKGGIEPENTWEG
jgi:hypothetical protein